MASRRLTSAQARRAALAAQGFAAPRPAVTPNLGHLRRMVRKVGVVQIDSVNVVERAHHLTLYARLGEHRQDLLWRALEQRHLFEYWGRMASFLPMEDFPLFRHRMQRFARGNWSKLKDLEARAPGYVEAVYGQVAERGPLATADLEEPGERAGPWWGWADGKIALEYLFSSGRVTVAFRRNFTRYYDIVERVIPSRFLDAEAPDGRRAGRELLLRAAHALGVGTARDLNDYYSLRVVEAKPLISELVADKALTEVEVEGWREAAYLPAEFSIPRSIKARALINPFDPFMWNRDRIQRLYGFHYRLEIYVPRAKRRHGYYVLPFLLDDELVARVDLKADRKARVLRVEAAFAEPEVDRSRVAAELARELGHLSRWLRLDAVAAGERGDLAPALDRAIRASDPA